MNIQPGQGMTLEDFTAALGLPTPTAVPQTPVTEVRHPAAPVPPAPVQQRPGQPRPWPRVTKEWHDRLIAVDEAAKGIHRLRQVPVNETTKTPRRAPAREALAATGANDISPELIKQVAQQTIRDELRREKSSYYYREPVSAEEWVNGADGQYRTPFRNL